MDAVSQHVERLKAAVAREPGNTRFRAELAMVYKSQGQWAQALACLQKIVALEPGNGVALNELGVCYFSLAEYAKAIEVFKKVLRIKHDIPDVHNNIGVALTKQRLYKAAEKSFLTSLRIQESEKTHALLGDLSFYSKDYDRSIAHYQQDQPPERCARNYNLSFPYLAKRDFRTGFRLYENRLAANDICPQTGQKSRVDIPWIPAWDASVPFRHLLVLYEQGIGDNIQYFRFIVELARRYPSSKITYFCKDVVFRLFDTYPDNITIVNALQENVFDFKAYVMSLPHLLQVDAIEPVDGNYLRNDAAKCAEWKERLGREARRPLRVGFTFNGLLTSFIEKYIPLQAFVAQLGDLDIDWICLHKAGEVRAESQRVASDKFHFYDIDALPFEDTVAILNNVDLVITVDTAVVHLAGVLGVKTWLLLGYGSDWRWSDADETYWYRSVELIRERENVELEHILKVVRAKLLGILTS